MYLYYSQSSTQTNLVGILIILLHNSSSCFIFKLEDPNQGVWNLVENQCEGMTERARFLIQILKILLFKDKYIFSCIKRLESKKILILCAQFFSSFVLSKTYTYIQQFQIINPLSLQIVSQSVKCLRGYIFQSLLSIVTWPRFS